MTSQEIKSYPVTFANTGIVLRNTPDEIPLTAYKALVNVITDRENTISVRKGFTRLNNGLPGSPYSFYLLKDDTGRLWRYAITGGQLYVAPVENPNDNSIWPLISGTDFLSVNGAGSLSSDTDPRALFATYTLAGSEIKNYMFMADGTQFLKHSGGLADARRIGIPKPVAPATIAAQSNSSTLIEGFETFSDFTPFNSIVSQVSPGIVGDAVQINGPSVPANGPGGMQRAFVAPIDLGTPLDGDSIQFWVNFPNGFVDRDKITRLTLAFGLGNIGDVSFTNKLIVDITQAGTPTDNPGYTALYNVGGISSWSLITFTKDQFHKFGPDPTIGWESVCAMYIEVESTATVDVQVDDLSLLTSGKLSGVDLQWTFTYFNSKTNTESDFADPVQVGFPASFNQYELTFPVNPSTTAPLADPDFINIYRMGGTVTQFQFVARIAYVPGNTPTYIDDIPDELLGDVLNTDNQLPPDEVKGIEIHDNRLWTWGGIQVGVPEPLNRLRFSKNVDVEEFPANNFVYVGNGSEEILRCIDYEGELYVFTLTRVYRVVGGGGNYQVFSTAVNQGLINPFDVCRGLRSFYMRSFDGIYEFPSGRKISEPINQVFFGETVNEIAPTVQSRQPLEAIAFYDNKVYFSYCATENEEVSNDRMLVFDTLYERWHWYVYGCQQMFFEPNTNIFVGGKITQWDSIVNGEPANFHFSGPWPMHLENGFADQCDDPDGFRGIFWAVDTRDYDLGESDQEKRFIDLVVDSDTQGYGVILQASFDGAPHDTIGVFNTTSRERVILPVLLGEGDSKLAIRCQLRILANTSAVASSATRLYKVIHRVLLEPPRHKTHVTNWSDYGVAGPKFFRELWLEMDTFGVPLDSVEVQVDQGVAHIFTEGLVTAGQSRLYLGLPPDIRGTLARLKVIPHGENEVKIYDQTFQTMTEPALINTIQTPYLDNGFPYKKLWKHVQLDVNTNNLPIGFNFWLDGQIVQEFEITTKYRIPVIKSFDQNLFGKLGRITVNEDFLDQNCCLPQGVRYYGAIFATDNMVPDVTLTDSFEQILDYDRYKILRRLWLVIANPDSNVNLDIYVDNVLKDSHVIFSDPAANTGFIKKRVDLKSGLKGKLFRFVFSSAFAFDLHWEKSEIEIRDLNTEDGYARVKNTPPQTY